MRESRIEKALRKRVEALGGLCEKFKSPGKNGVPDRIITLPGNIIIFVELKAPGKEPEPLQVRDHIRRRKLGCDVRIIDSLKQAEIFPNVE